jgi:beta-glucosidase
VSKKLVLAAIYLAVLPILLLPRLGLSQQLAKPWLDAKLSVEQRVELLLAQMTLIEKLQMVEGVDNATYSGEIPSISRLNIPALYLQDGSAGVRMSDTAALPSALALAASWDPQMASLYGTVIARDDRAKGANVTLGPMINIDRTAQAGRNFESFGEDPYLASQMVAPEIAAIQSNHVIATTKHYALNNQENGRLRDSSDVDMRTFHEIYLPAFEAAANAGTGAIMCSYNRINTIWACENPKILDILKQEVGFSGFVMSDWGATHSTVASANAGLDMEMPGGDGYFGKALATAITNDSVKRITLDEKVRRILHSMFAAGLFEYPPQNGIVPEAADRRDALTLAEQGAVLLKNDSHLLPLDAQALHSIALIGADMDEDTRGGSAWVQGTGTVSPLDAILKSVGPNTSVQYVWAQGVPFISPLPTVDSLSLTPPNATSGVHGVRADYFSNADLTGEPAFTQVEPAVYANWQFSAPKSIRSTTYSVRWTGTFSPPVTGIYTFGIESRNGARLFFDGTKVVDAWKSGYSIRSQVFQRKLLANHSYPIIVEAHGDASSFQLCRLIWQPPAGAKTPDISRAVELAKNSDVAIVFAGEFRTEQYDRSTIALVGMQEQLIRAVAHANPHTIVILNNGGAVALGSWAHNVHSILDMWYSGEEKGAALAALLFGEVNPSGKLPVTFPEFPIQVVAKSTWSAEPYSGPARAINYDEKLNVGYRWYDRHSIAPLFPFGFGLSYTTFAYSHLTIQTPHAGGDSTIAVDVTNIGKLPGAEVAQLYLRYPASSGEPPKVLRGFGKAFLKPDQTEHMIFQLHPHDFSIWDENTRQWKLIPGSYAVLVGSSSRDIRLVRRLLIKGSSE